MLWRRISIPGKSSPRWRAITCSSGTKVEAPICTKRGSTSFGTFTRAKVSLRVTRSEEHTSELQSHVNLVCRLLLEKKKRNNINCRHFKLHRLSYHPRVHNSRLAASCVVSLPLHVNTPLPLPVAPPQGIQPAVHPVV